MTKTEMLRNKKRNMFVGLTNLYPGSEIIPGEGGRYEFTLENGDVYELNRGSNNEWYALSVTHSTNYANPTALQAAQSEEARRMESEIDTAITSLDSAFAQAGNPGNPE